MLKRGMSLVLCLCMALTVTQGCGGSKGAAELEFAQNTLKALVAGDPAADQAIAWESFQAQGVNMGQIYSSMPNETGKAAMRSSFLTAFASTAKQSGVNFESVEDWKVEKQEGDKTFVSAVGPSGKFTLTVAIVNGALKITGYTMG